jgi:DNA-binding MarR family transcriptional regulator
MDKEGPVERVAADRAAASHDAPLRLEEFLPYRLNVVATLVSQALSRIYVERYAIGVPEWRVLVTLGQYGVMTAKAIGAHSHMHKTKVSRAVAVLERRKLVARKSNNADLRESLLSLTAAGRAMYEDLAPIALEFSRKLTGVLSAAEHQALDHAIDVLISRSSALALEEPPRRGRG